MREITPWPPHTPHQTKHWPARQNNCNSIVRHDFCFLYTILTLVVRSENIIMPFLVPDRSTHILLEKYGYYTWPITVLDRTSHSPFMIIPLFYSQLMFSPIILCLSGLRARPSVSARHSRPSPGQSAPLSLRSSYSWRQILLRKEIILRQLKDTSTQWRKPEQI